MAKMKYGYGWALKWVLAAVLIAAGIYMVVDQAVVYIITGISIVVFSLFRVYPLLKSLNKEALRTINLIEILIALVLGVIMIYAGFAQRDPNVEGALLAPWNGLYRWFLAFFLYVRGLVFFVSTSFFEEKTEVPKFIFHIVAISLGAIFVVWDNFSAQVFGWIFFIISIGGAAYLGFDGYGGYRKYREYSKSINQPKEKEKFKDTKIEKELPKHIEDEVEQPETYIS
ncbi:MAG: hypothetical protein RQ856_03395 [Candidatus Izemoplasmatales bacterium]|nr:hypothetical protein [Candidatus Izemoplasmatales bacterium]